MAVFRWTTHHWLVNLSPRPGHLTAPMTTRWRPATLPSSPPTALRVRPSLLVKKWFVKPFSFSHQVPSCGRVLPYLRFLRNCAWHRGVHWRSHGHGPHRHVDLRPGDRQGLHLSFFVGSSVVVCRKAWRRIMNNSMKRLSPRMNKPKFPRRWNRCWSSLSSADAHSQGDWALYPHHHGRGCLPRRDFLHPVADPWILLVGGRHLPHWHHRCQRAWGTAGDGHCEENWN